VKEELMAPAVRGLASERGTVLIAALMVIVLVGTLGAALVMVVSTESGTAANYQAAQQALYAADAGIERAAGDLRLLASWRDVPAPASASPRATSTMVCPSRAHPTAELSISCN
jgi:Tfp pilus assembly protein PilX